MTDFLNDIRQRPRLGAWNSVMDMLSWWKRSFANGRPFNPQHYARPTNTVKLFNDTADDVGRYKTMEIGSAILDYMEDTHEPWFLGLKPTLNPRQVAVLWTECAAKSGSNRSVAIAQTSGQCMAYVNIDATYGAYHRRARPTKDSYVLQSDWAGPMEIVARPSGTGEQLCCVRMYSPNTVAYWVKTPSGGIPAATYTASGVTPGWAVCSLWPWDSAQAKNVPSAVPIRIGNKGSEAVGGDAFVRASSDEDWQLIADIEYCVDGLADYY